METIGKLTIDSIVMNTTGKRYPTPSLTRVRLYPKETAKVVRTVLKAAYPAVTFSVTTGRGSMVSSVDLRWQDGPSVREVDAIVWRFKSGNFNGMTDSFDHDRDRRIVVDGVLYEPCCEYVGTSRTVSPALANRCIARLVAYWGGIDDAPMAIASKWGSGYELQPSVSNNLIRADVAGGSNWEHHLTWGSQIHQCAAEPERFVRDLRYAVEEAQKEHAARGFDSPVAEPTPEPTPEPRRLSLIA